MQYPAQNERVRAKQQVNRIEQKFSTAKTEQWGRNEYDPNEQVSLKYVCLFSSQSTENELIHPNNTDWEKFWTRLS